MTKRFPRTESEITALALRVAEGLATAEEDFPTPPVSATELKAKLDVFNAADTATRAAEKISSTIAILVRARHNVPIRSQPQPPNAAATANTCPSMCQGSSHRRGP